jgi:serine/threonine protein kinase/Flp pilus assembly protein TadD
MEHPMIGQSVSHYRILEKLGEGGMGVVYKAQDLKLDRPVAIKFLPSHLSAAEENKARFIQEARATAALNHPNILNVYDIDEQPSAEGAGGMYFVMEYVEGKTLKSHIASLKAGQGILIPQTLDWVVQVAQGLRAAHEKGIVHRDIKSENIMLSADGHPKVMDFGIAKLKGGSGLTKAGVSVGTLSYMSPEQAQGVAADERTDIWSLGIVLYEMLTGELPFRAEHEPALMYLIVNEQPQAPSQIDRRVPPQVDAVVMKMLEKDRSVRFQNMAEVVKALTELRTDVASTQAGKTKTIAVLPFANMSADAENEYFSDGLTEEIIASLSRLKDMKIIARTTSMQYKGTKKDIKTIGRELGARYIMEGSVRKYQDNLRITAQFIDVDDGTQIWAETYRGTLADVFDFQENVSKQIVDALMLKLSPTEKVVLTKRPTVNAEAFDCYLRARDFLYRRTKSNVQIAIDLFRKATELDPRFAAAYAGLGEAFASYYQDLERNEAWLDKGMEAGLKAQMYDPSLSEAYATLAVVYYWKTQLGKGSLNDAFEAGKKAIELDPNNYIGHWILGRIYHTSDRDQEAADLFTKVISLNPDFYSAYGDLQIVYERLGRKELLQSTLDLALAMYPRYLHLHPDEGRARMYYAIDLTKVGRHEEAKNEAARAIQLNPDDPLMLYNAGCFYARLGEKQLAIETLHKSIRSGFENFEWMKRDTDLENIRSEQGFIELMAGT